MKKRQRKIGILTEDQLLQDVGESSYWIAELKKVDDVPRKKDTGSNE